MGQLVGQNLPFEYLLDFLEYDISIKQEGEKYFLGNGNGVLFYSSTTKLARACRKRVDQLNIKGVKPFHSLRGWAITFLLAQGFPIPKVQDMVGHEDVKTTMGYWNLMQNSSKDLVGHLGSVNESSIKKLGLQNSSLYI